MTLNRRDKALLLCGIILSVTGTVAAALFAENQVVLELNILVGAAAVLQMAWRKSPGVVLLWQGIYLAATNLKLSTPLLGLVLFETVLLIEIFVHAQEQSRGQEISRALKIWSLSLGTIYMAMLSENYIELRIGLLTAYFLLRHISFPVQSVVQDLEDRREAVSVLPLLLVVTPLYLLLSQKIEIPVESVFLIFAFALIAAIQSQTRLFLSTAVMGFIIAEPTLNTFLLPVLLLAFAGRLSGWVGFYYVLFQTSYLNINLPEELAFTLMATMGIVLGFTSSKRGRLLERPELYDGTILVIGVGLLVTVNSLTPKTSINIYGIILLCVTAVVEALMRWVPALQKLREKKWKTLTWGALEKIIPALRTQSRSFITEQKRKSAEAVYFKDVLLSRQENVYLYAALSAIVLWGVFIWLF